MISLDPKGGTYTEQIEVEVVEDGSPVEMHMTLDGTEPTLSSATVINGSIITVARPKQIRVKSWYVDDSTDGAVEDYVVPVSGFVIGSDANEVMSINEDGL